MKNSNKNFNGYQYLRDFMDTLAIELKSYRKARGLSQDELARRSKVSKTTISSLENKRAKDLQFSTLCLIAMALNKEPIELLVASKYNIPTNSNKEFTKAYEELNAALSTIRPIYQHFKNEV